MSAVMAKRLDPEEERYSLKEIDSELEALGKWVERHEDYQGYPSVNVLEAALMGRGGSIPGHIVLCLDMPIGIYATWSSFLRLPVEEREVVGAHYYFRVHENTVPRPQYYVRNGVFEAKWVPLGISESTYWRRLRVAKLRILGLTSCA